MSLVKNIARVALGVGSAVGGWLAYSALAVDHEMPLPPGIPAERHTFFGPQSCQLSYFSDMSGQGRPLVLLHSINAAGSAYEMRPIFQHYRGIRPVYALDLPGFGFSERSNRTYTIDLYVNAILDFLRRINEPADVIALSLTSEFAAHAALSKPGLFHSLTLISPTGLNDRQNKADIQKASEGSGGDKNYAVLANPIWAQPFYDLLATKPSISYFLRDSFYGPVDPGLAEYGYLTTHQPGARFAPLYFVSGKLFTPDIMTSVYQKLQVPVLVLFDQDPHVTFDLLPRILESNNNWRARRIPNTRGLPHFERMGKVADELNVHWSDLQQIEA